MLWKAIGAWARVLIKHDWHDGGFSKPLNIYEFAQDLQQCQQQRMHCENDHLTHAKHFGNLPEYIETQWSALSGHSQSNNPSSAPPYQPCASGSALMITSTWSARQTWRCCNGVRTMSKLSLRRRANHLSIVRQAFSGKRRTEQIQVCSMGIIRLMIFMI